MITKCKQLHFAACNLCYFLILYSFYFNSSNHFLDFIVINTALFTNLFPQKSKNIKTIEPIVETNYARYQKIEEK